MYPSLLSTQQTLEQFDSATTGLTEEAAKQKLKEVGPNLLKPPKGEPLWREILAPFSSIFVIVLIGAIIVSLATNHLLDAVVIGVVVISNAIIEWYQSFTAKNVLAALKKYESKEVLVRRGGIVHPRTIEQLVPGDIVEISEGDKIPADGRLLKVAALQIDESSLTGESLAIEKHTTPLTGSPKLFEQTNMVFQGTSVTAGRGELCITATGQKTEFGKIADLTVEPHEKPLLQIKIDQLARQVIIFAIVTGILTFGLGLYRGYSIDEMLRFVLALTVSSVPEGLPVALTIIFLLGIKRMAQHQAVVRHLPTIETLGMITMIATDKTGTLTKNKLEVTDRWSLTKTDLAAAIAQSVSHSQTATDPVDIAITSAADKPAGQEVGDIPFNQAARLSAVAWHEGDQMYAYAKGAPEAIVQRCILNSSQQAAIAERMEFMATRGYRVLALSRKRLIAGHDLHLKQLTKMEFLGLVALSDGVRPDAAAAVLQAQRAGIEVMMLTGDHLATAKHVAQQVHITKRQQEVALGEEVEKLSGSGLLNWLGSIKVLARVLPQNKYDVVEALRRRHIVAMTGDGVNDAPALVQADVGVAMGSGTDTAKAASDMILLDNSFATIVRAIREGRTIYANVRKMVFYLFSTNIGEVLTMVGALLFGLPLPVTAAQILWINLVTDGTVVIPLGLDPHEAHHMNKPPRKMNAPILDRRLIVRIGLVAITVAAVSLAVFAWYLQNDAAKAQTMAFLAIVVAQWANAFNARSEEQSVWHGIQRPNYKLWAGLAIGAVLQIGLMLEPFRSAFGLVMIGWQDAAVLILPFIAVIAVVELHKIFSRNKRA